ncbi:MAG: FecR domain-containing protein [Deltaproteobacteria bacterium]|nr:FecR domain-containing protein [Deltaproteobacteria bacterium]
MSDEKRLDSGEDLSADERALLAEWRAPSPPPGFAEAVLARASAAEASARRRPDRRWIPLAVAAVAALLLVSILGRPRRATEGEIVAQERSTVAIGDRAVAVVEPGARLSWSVASDGSAVLEQTRGSVFFRVDHGPKFEVHTPEGTVRVLGTCFRVEVNEMRVRDAALAGAGGGAALTALVMVTVLEGRVVTASPKGELALSAGERAELGPNGVRRTAETPVSASAALEPARPGAAGGPASGSTTISATMESLPLPARLEITRLRQRVTELEGELTEQKQKSRGTKTYDLSQEELDQLASKCALSWDMPPLEAEPNKMNPEDAEELGLSAADRAAVDEVYRAHHRAMRVELEKLYTETTGDANVGSLSMDAMIAEIEDKTPRDKTQRIFQRLARERAGQAVPPSAEAQSTTERLMRLLTTAGDRFEAKVGERIGPKMAHALRDLHEGFGSRSRSTVGCPK